MYRVWFQFRYAELATLMRTVVGFGPAPAARIECPTRELAERLRGELAPLGWVRVEFIP